MAGKERKLVQADKPADGGVGTNAVAQLTMTESMENVHNIWISAAASPVSADVNMDGMWAVWAIRTATGTRSAPSATVANIENPDNQDILMAAGVFVASNESPWNMGSMHMGNISRNLPKGGTLTLVVSVNGITAGNASVDAFITCNTRTI